MRLLGPMPKRWRWGLSVCGVLLALVLLGCATVPALTRGPDGVDGPVVGSPAVAPVRDPVLSVMTLNVAHGRSSGPNQLLRRKGAIEANLRMITDMLVREDPDVVALQEADGPSFWSGNFNHVEYLAEGAEYPSFVRAENVKGFGLSYGTAILSEGALQDAYAGTFAPSWPTFSKGYVIATVDWPGRPKVQIDVVSVHLDFARGKVRAQQVGELIEALSGRDRPLVVMGDFNCEWTDKDSPLRNLAEGLDLRAWEPEAEEATFPTTGARLDWILISEALKFRSHRVLPDVLSDHHAVAAEISLR